MNPTDSSPLGERPGDDVIDRYCLGVPSPEDCVAIEAWRRREPGDVARLDQLRETLARPAVALTAEDVAAGVHAVQQATQGTIQIAGTLHGSFDTSQRQPVDHTQERFSWQTVRRRGVGLGSQILRREGAGIRTRIHPNRKWVGNTAVALSIAVIFSFLIFRDTSWTNRGVTHVYTTTSGQQAIWKLDDGTQVILAPHSTLRINHFGKQSRTVMLDDGEAFFDVVHATGVPFIVRSGAGTARVLGTTFFIRHVAGTTHTHVAVGAGKVVVTSGRRVHDDVTLIAGGIGDIDDSTINVSQVNEIAPGTEWRHDQLIFRDMSVSKVLATLSQWYGYQFHCTDSTLARQIVTIGVSRKSSAAALAALEQILGVNLTVAGDTITLTPQALHPSARMPRARTYDVWTPTRESGK